MTNQSRTPRPPRKHESFPEKHPVMDRILSGIALPAMTAAVTSLILVSSNPNIPDSSAHTFLSDYYSSIVNPHQRIADYNIDLTSNFRDFPGHTWQSVNKFFSDERQVIVTSIIPLSGNPDAFTASLAYYNKNGSEDTETTNFYLVCDGYFLARLPFISCPPGHLKIDNTETPDASVPSVPSGE